jgi:hypothetical protein
VAEHQGEQLPAAQKIPHSNEYEGKPGLRVKGSSQHSEI